MKNNYGITGAFLAIIACVTYLLNNSTKKTELESMLFPSLQISTFGLLFIMMMLGIFTLIFNLRTNETLASSRGRGGTTIGFVGICILFTGLSTLYVFDIGGWRIVLLVVNLVLLGAYFRFIRATLFLRDMIVWEHLKYYEEKKDVDDFVMAILITYFPAYIALWNSPYLYLHLFIFCAGLCAWLYVSDRKKDNFMAES